MILNWVPHWVEENSVVCLWHVRRRRISWLRWKCSTNRKLSKVAVKDKSLTKSKFNHVYGMYSTLFLFSIPFVNIFFFLFDWRMEISIESKSEIDFTWVDFRLSFQSSKYFAFIHVFLWWTTDLFSTWIGNRRRTVSSSTTGTKWSIPRKSFRSLYISSSWCTSLLSSQQCDSSWFEAGKSAAIDRRSNQIIRFWMVRSHNIKQSENNVRYIGLFTTWNVSRWHFFFLLNVCW